MVNPAAMATVAPPSEQAAGLLENLSLDSQTKTVDIPEPEKKGIYSNNGTAATNQGYGLGTYLSPNASVNSQPYGTYHYQYPNYSASQTASHGDVLPSSATGKVLSLVGTATGNPNNNVNTGNVNRNNGPRPFRPSNHNTSSNMYGSYKRGALPTGFPSSTYPDFGVGYDRFQSPFSWYDPSMFSTGPTRHGASTAYTSSQNSHSGRPTSGFGQPSGFMNMMYPNGRMYGQYGTRTGADYGSFGYDSWTNGRGWVVVDNKYKPRVRGYGNDENDSLSEMNKGPRAKDLKNQNKVEPLEKKLEEQNLQLAENNEEDNLPQIPDKAYYNGEDFPEDYSDAKFFVIKSYSEDDVHKSIKYNVWTSTPNGNKKLDVAYHEAKKDSAGCPVFLLFSVNTSGQFVGLAEMVGPVDFNKTVEYWQQDKWSGCFPVKWHIIKDVPNNSLRHITLENNENKPVTNSRDTQEVVFEKGIEILKIFMGHKGKTSILDDFEFYSMRETVIREKRAKQKIQKQALDGKRNDSVSDDKDKASAMGKESSDNSKDQTLMKETGGAAADESVKADGEVNLPEDNGPVAPVETSTENAKSEVSSEKKVAASNVAASAC